MLNTFVTFWGKFLSHISLCLQVGACLVNQDNKIISTGHNCMPNGCEGKLPWRGKSDDKNEVVKKIDTKYVYGENAHSDTPCFFLLSYSVWLYYFRI